MRGDHLLDPLKIAKLASAFQLFIFALECLAVIVMRESGLKSYDPGYRTPLYPYLPLFGILAPFEQALVLLGVAFPKATVGSS